MGWGLLLNRYTLLAALAVAGYFGVRWGVAAIEQRGYDRKTREVEAEAAKVERANVKFVISREELSDEARDAMRARLVDYGRSVQVEYRLSMERLDAQLPVFPGVCRAPDGVVREFATAVDGANAAASGRL